MKNRALVATVAVLILAVAVLAYLNQQSLRGLDQSAENPQLIISREGEKVASIDLEEMKTLGVEEIETTLRSSGSPPRDDTYRGIPLGLVLSHVDPGLLEEAGQVTARAADGYVVAYSAEELARPDHLYVIFERGGQRLKGKAQGGDGPLLLMARQDEFGQRWCKFLVEVSVKP